ncbi:putative oxidoreductase P32A8.02 like protein [Verticillium longisporum]|uniref:Putative oxidoreductase P32A8.02 like protein n=1 Tax=Verticillium longisporum TaxID=100787 RepID=A0A8I3A144_VERLO|nr:putative oxidoreductase P32A8.02 like protein [Verticillium longisporum]
MASTKFSLSTKAKLSNGATIPQIQLGLYMMSGREATSSVKWALAAGYRGFDCAQMYHNESEAGKAIHDFLASNENTHGLTREDVFYTSKLASNGTSPYGGKEARLTSWKAIEDAIDDGEIKLGGVSNYGSKHIEELMASKPRIQPVINQIEVHPFNTQTSIRETCAKYNITIEAYAPLARAMRMKHPEIIQLSRKYSCSPAQLLVRWSLQHNMVTLPKSSRKERLIENANVNGFQISDDDMAVMNALDENLVTDWDPTDAP